MYNHITFTALPILSKQPLSHNLCVIVLSEDQPVKSEENPDQAYTKIVEGIKKVVEELRPLSDRQRKIG
jgi:hypothetical protein